MGASLWTSSLAPISFWSNPPMKTRQLMTIKPHKYGTRHLVAGDEYEVPPRHAVALVAARRARFADKGPYVAEKPAAKPAPPQPQCRRPSRSPWPR